ncbi:THO complex subunit 5 homolog [Ciona intestinalis]
MAETEADGLDMSDNLINFSSICEDLRKIMSKVVDLKSEGKDAKNEIIELRMKGSFHFLSLKQLNRCSQIKCKQMKDQTLETKQRLDTYNLQLENLQYEISHLHKEITKCLEFRSRHDDITLVSVKDFYEQAPTSISKPGTTKSNEHNRTLARLDHELVQRKTLAGELGQLKENKTNVLEEIGKKKQHLQILAPALQNLLKSSLPIQEVLDLPISKTQKQHKTSQLLPRPLFVLFLQAKAYQEACDPNMEVDIHGDTDAAMKLLEDKTSGGRVIDATGGVGSGGESDSEGEDVEEQDTARRRNRKKEMSTDLPTTGVYSPHPLVVTIKLFNNAGVDIELKFSFLPKLNFVCVQSTTSSSSKMTEVLQSPILGTNNLLQCLGEGGDWGTTCPNPTPMSPNMEMIYGVGRPYMWVQRLCGVDCMGGNLKGEDMHTSSTHMDGMMKQIRSRVASRVGHVQQVERFQRQIVQRDVQISRTLPDKIHTTLSSWATVEHNVYSSLEYTRPVVELGLLGGDVEAHSYYITKLRRGSSAELNVAIVVFVDHPVQPPLVCLCLEWMGQRTATNDDNIRTMEVEVNVNLPKLVKNLNEILPSQVLRLMSMLDVYVETESETKHPIEFPMDKFCSKKFKGPSRMKPYVYMTSSKQLRH